jgi:hypothetical protein
LKIEKLNFESVQILSQPRTENPNQKAEIETLEKERKQSKQDQSKELKPGQIELN